MILTADYKSVRIAFAPVEAFDSFLANLHLRTERLGQLLDEMREKESPPRSFFDGDQDIPKFAHQVLVDLDLVLQSAAPYAGRVNPF